MKISAIITLKKDVLDPQGKVIQQTLEDMSFQNINEVFLSLPEFVDRARIIIYSIINLSFLL